MRLLSGGYDGLFVRYFWLSTFGAVNSSTILAVYVVDAVESDDFGLG